MLGSKIVLCDTSWILQKAYYSFSLSHQNNYGAKIKTGEFYGFIDSMLRVLEIFHDFDIVFALDHPSSWRKKFCYSYKAHRESSKPIYEKLPECLLSISLFPSVFIAAGEFLEVDDVIADIILRNPEKQGVIYSVDNDLWQLISPTVKSFFSIREGKPVFIDELMVGFKWGVRPDKLPFYRAFLGDVSDNLRGYSRIPKSFCKWAVETFGSPEEFLKSGDGGKIADDIRRFPALLRRNYHLMKLEKKEGVEIKRLEGTWEFFDKYGCETLKQKVGLILGRLQGENL